MKNSKKKLFISILFAGAAFFPVSSLAAPLTYVDEIIFHEEQGYVSGIFTPGPHSLKLWHPLIDPVGSLPAPENILSATLTIETRDDRHDRFFSREYWLVFSNEEWVNNDSLWDLVASDGSHPFVLDIDQIREHGGAEVAIIALWGDFYVLSSTLVLTYESDENSPVPEPGSVLLLGSGLIGLALIMRKKWPLIG